MPLKLSPTGKSPTAKGGRLVAVAASAAFASWPGATPAAKLPDTIVLPAARTEDLTPANGWPSRRDYASWTRSLGGPTCARFSTLVQINPGNVSSLVPAWTYHSRD